MPIISSDEYQTPKKYIKAAIEVMGSIDVDLACSDKNYVRLEKYIKYHFNKDHNALKQHWTGNCWLNPPYSKPNLTIFTKYLIEQGKYQTFKQLIYLVPSYTAERWYQSCLSNCFAFCLPNHRIEHLINGKIQDAPRFSSTFFYFGLQTPEFLRVFSRFGQVFFHPSIN